jgi:signal transduction histidine kinase
MADLARWLEAHLDVVTEAAAASLAKNDALKAEVEESIQAFYDGLLRCVAFRDPTVLNVILIDWVESRSAPTDLELATFMPVLTTLKKVTSEQIIQHSPPDEAVLLLLQADSAFIEAITYLSKLETDAVLADVRSQLNKAQAHVRRLDKSKSNFIAVAAHELRTPLTLVEGYADMISGTGWAESEPQARLLLDGIASGTRRLREIINDMIDVSLLDLKMMELHPQPVWLLQVLNAAERNLRKQLGSRELTITIETETIPTQPTYADPDKLLQVLQKVLLNAVKYTPDGGTIIVRARELPGFTDIMVIDNGIGIAPSNLSAIFDTFSALGDASLHSSGKTKFKGGGPGLGLPIAKGIIEAHGGTIWAESEGYDEVRCPGSTFHIMIPMRGIMTDATMKDVSAVNTNTFQENNT